MTNEIDDIGSYANDLIARIYEFLELREASVFTEQDLVRSEALHVEAQSLDLDPINMKAIADYVNTYISSSLPGLASMYPGNNRQDWIHTDSDFALALQLAAGQDQFEAMQIYEQTKPS